jgi:hypothetical protein
MVTHSRFLPNTDVNMIVPEHTGNYAARPARYSHWDLCSRRAARPQLAVKIGQTVNFLDPDV